MNDKINVGNIIKFYCVIHHNCCIGQVIPHPTTLNSIASFLWFKVIHGGSVCSGVCNVEIKHYKIYKEKLTKEEKVVVMKYLLTGVKEYKE